MTYPDPIPTSWRNLHYAIAVLQCLQFVVASMFVLSLVSTKSMITQGYNLYVVFLCIPDAILNGIHAVKNVFKGIGGGDDNNDPKSTNEKNFWMVLYWITMFYYLTNFVQNAIIAHEIYDMLRKSHGRRRVQPPTPSKVLKQTSFAYGLAAVWTTWCVLDVPWSPNHIEDGRLISGSSQPGGVFTPTAAMVLTLSVYMSFMLYTLCVGCIVWKKKLLPTTTGKTRSIFMYFTRIFWIFLGFYFPVVILGAYETAKIEDAVVYFWINFAIGLFIVLQCALTMCFAMTKDDIRLAVTKFWWRNKDNNNNNNRTTEQQQRQQQKQCKGPSSPRAPAANNNDNNVYDEYDDEDYEIGSQNDTSILYQTVTTTNKNNNNNNNNNIVHHHESFRNEDA